MVGRAFGAHSNSGSDDSISDPAPDVGIGTAKDVATDPAAATATAISPGTGIGAREDGTHLATGEIGFRHD
jgi:hypothetical protein